MNETYIKATTRGRITIPIEIRKKLGIKGGNKLHVIADEKHNKIAFIPKLGKK